MNAVILSPAAEQLRSQWLTLAEVRAIAKVSKATWWRWEKSLPKGQRLPRHKVGGRWRYRLDQVNYFLESQAVA